MARPGIFGIRLHHPAQMVVAAFAVTILVGTALLMLPFATVSPGGTRPITALFTATSAVCVTGLATVDTATHWSGAGHAVILALIQIGGFGLMTLASFAVLLISHRLGLRSRLLARLETGALDLGDVGTLVAAIVRFTLLFEGIAAALLAVRFLTAYDESLPSALWLGVFHAVSAFNNAGFALFTDNLIPLAGDEVLLMVIAATIVAGGLGFPVWMDLRRQPTAFRRWTLHTKLVVTMTAALLVVGTVALTAFEWDNPETLGGRSTVDTVANGVFASVTPRTAGFNSIDYGAANDETILVSTLLMFIGAGPASTGGGIKVTTAAVLALMVLAEVRGDPDVNRFGRRIPANAQRQALAVVVAGLAALFTGNLLLTATSPFSIGDTLFEATSAFGTVGLSTGITPLLADPPQLVLVVLMFLGRVGPLTLGTALVLRERDRLYRFAEERPIIG